MTQSCFILNSIVTIKLLLDYTVQNYLSKRTWCPLVKYANLTCTEGISASSALDLSVAPCNIYKKKTQKTIHFFNNAC